jgi:hypothetical protein
MTPLSLLWEITLLRVITPPLTTWDALLPDQAKRLPDELAQVDTYLDDERFITHWHAHFLHQAGRPSVPVRAQLERTVSQDAQLTSSDRGADQPPQARLRAAAHQAAAPCGRADLGGAWGLRLQPAADDGGGCRVIQQPGIGRRAGRSLHPIESRCC